MVHWEHHLDAFKSYVTLSIKEYQFNGVEYIVYFEQYGKEFSLNKSSLELRIKNMNNSSRYTDIERFALNELEKRNNSIKPLDIS